MKKIMAVILMMIFLLCVQSISAYDGTCGDNVAYTISTDTISFSKANSGSDAVWRYSCRETFQNNSDIKIIKILDTIRLVDGEESFKNLEYIEEMYLSKLDVSGLTDIMSMFRITGNGYGTYGYSHSNNVLKKLDASGWNTSNVTDIGYLFYGYLALEYLDVSGWDTSNVKWMRYIFGNCSSLKSLDLSSWNTSNVEDMNGIFYGCNSLSDLNITGWKTSNVTDMGAMFSGCQALDNLAVSDWDTSKVLNMGELFNACVSLSSLDVSKWNTSIVVSMLSMFTACYSLESLDLSGWDTSNVENMDRMFLQCSSLANLDVRGWDTSKVTQMSTMFNGCSSLQTISLGINTLAQNIFKSLPDYANARWYYIAPGPDAEDPIAPGSIRISESLFTDFQAGEMAGIWSTDPDYLTVENRLTLPDGLQEIGESAFEGSASVEEVILPNGLIQIGSKAFAGCGKLKLIHVPDSVTSIAEDAFRNTVTPVFVCQSDNDGAAYAREHNIACLIAQQ